MKTTTVLLNRINFRYGWTLIMLLALPLWFASCSKDKDADGNPDVKPSAVEGSWKISGMKTNVDMELPDGSKTKDFFVVLKLVPGGDALIACLTDTKITFNGNGSITGTASPNCQAEGSDDLNPIEDKSTWKVDGNKLTITSGGSAEVYDMNISGNTMTLTMPGEDMNDDGKADLMILEFKKA
ncbi:hypothetical protein GCM10027347_15250 [Larkinella harenae]